MVSVVKCIARCETNIDKRFGGGNNTASAIAAFSVTSQGKIIVSVGSNTKQGIHSCIEGAALGQFASGPTGAALGCAFEIVIDAGKRIGGTTGKVATAADWAALIVDIRRGVYTRLLKVPGLKGAVLRETRKGLNLAIKEFVNQMRLMSEARQIRTAR